MSAKNSIMAFLGGAAVGAVVALLFAPEKGEVTRRKIGKAVGEGKDKVVDTFEHGRDVVADKIKKGRERLSDAYHEGRERLADAIAEGRDIMEEEIELMCESAERKTPKRK